RQRMGSFANKLWVQILSWVTAIIIVALNVRLVIMSTAEWLAAKWLWLIVGPLGALLIGLLIWVTFEPLFRRAGRPPLSLPQSVGAGVESPAYRRILVPLDHTDLDRQAIGHAAAMARLHHAKLFLLHVEEGVTSQVYGAMSSTAEVQAGQKYLDQIVESLKAE